MPRIVVYDEGATPQKVLVVTGTSENQGDWDDSGRTDFLVHPDLTAVSAVPQRYWKVVGLSVVAMTAGEQSAQDLAEMASRDSESKLGGKQVRQGRSTQDIHVRANSFVTREELNRAFRCIRQLVDAIVTSTGGTDNLRTAVSDWEVTHDLTNVTKLEWNIQLDAFIDGMNLDDPGSDL